MSSILGSLGDNRCWDENETHQFEPWGSLGLESLHQQVWPALIESGCEAGKCLRDSKEVTRCKQATHKAEYKDNRCIDHLKIKVYKKLL